MAERLRNNNFNISYLYFWTIFLIILSFITIVSSTCYSGYYAYFNNDTNCKKCSSVIYYCNTCTWNDTYKTVFCNTCNSGYYLINPNSSTQSCESCSSKCKTVI